MTDDMKALLEDARDCIMDLIFKPPARSKDVGGLSSRCELVLKEIERSLGEAPTTDETMGWNAALDRLGVIIAGDLTEIEERIERGKGTWPERGYVRDEDWARFLERRDTFAAVMRKISSLRATQPTAPTVPATDGVLCMQCSAPVPDTADFCDRCLASARRAPSPTVPATCATCGGSHRVLLDDETHVTVPCPDCAGRAALAAASVSTTP